MSIDGDTIPVAVNNGGFSDPNFANNKKIPIHRWVPWIAGFSGDFVDSAIDKYLDETGKTILDPFCGVGTALLCAIQKGHNAIGFEINPYAALASKVKTTAHLLDTESLESEIKRFKNQYSKKINDEKTPRLAPSGFRTRKEFYSPRVLTKVLWVLKFMTTVRDETIADLFRLAFGSTMVQYSNYSYEPSLGTRECAGKEDISDYDVRGAITDKLHVMVEDISQAKREITTAGRAEVFCDSFFKYKDYMIRNSIDLLITSPPYMNNYHYVRNTRPQLFWLNFVSTPFELKHLEVENFGKYWQTVRQSKPVKLILRKRIPEIEKCINRIRRVNPEKRVYGGRGWANYVVSYFNDCYRFAHGIKYCLKNGGVANVVLGNNIIQGVEVPTDVFFGKIVESVGLELVEIHVPREKRIGNSIIRSTARVRKAGKNAGLHESVVEIVNN